MIINEQFLYCVLMIFSNIFFFNQYINNINLQLQIYKIKNILNIEILKKIDLLVLMIYFFVLFFAVLYSLILIFFKIIRQENYRLQIKITKILVFIIFINLFYVISTKIIYDFLFKIK